VAVENAVFWDVTPRGCCENRRSTETSALTIAKRCNIPEDGILQLESLPKIYANEMNLLENNIETTKKSHRNANLW
jgi:hypothetical protein